MDFNNRKASRSRYLRLAVIEGQRLTSTSDLNNDIILSRIRTGDVLDEIQKGIQCGE
jgi:hypothetical protein